MTRVNSGAHWGKVKGEPLMKRGEETKGGSANAHQQNGGGKKCHVRETR